MLSNACHGLGGEECHSLPSSIRAKKARLGIGSGLGLTITYCVILDKAQRSSFHKCQFGGQEMVYHTKFTRLS